LREALLAREYELDLCLSFHCLFCFSSLTHGNLFTICPLSSMQSGSGSWQK
jgi:hypothetical protein